MAGVREAGRGFEPPAPARAKLFKHGGSQAVRLPKGFRFEGEEVEVRKEGDAVILGSVKRQGGPALWARIDAIEAGGPIDYVEQPVIDELAFDRDE